MRITVFDTETISTNKPFVYNIGYLIYDTETEKTLLKKDFVVKEIWQNKELFETAYYAEKRQIYINRMRARKVKMLSFKDILKEIENDINYFNVEIGYAFNSPFDTRVFEFNTDWFKKSNPLDNLRILDIATFVHNKIAFTKEYQQFCEENELFTESGNYSTTAESVTRFLRNDNEFIEEHTALADSEIELEILLECVKRGCEFDKEYKKYSSIPRRKTVKINVRNTTYEYENIKRVKINKDKTEIDLIW